MLTMRRVIFQTKDNASESLHRVALIYDGVPGGDLLTGELKGISRRLFKAWDEARHLSVGSSVSSLTFISFIIHVCFFVTVLHLTYLLVSLFSSYFFNFIISCSQDLSDPPTILYLIIFTTSFPNFHHQFCFPFPLSRSFPLLSLNLYHCIFFFLFFFKQPQEFITVFLSTLFITIYNFFTTSFPNFYHQLCFSFPLHRFFPFFSFHFHYCIFFFYFF